MSLSERRGLAHASHDHDHGHHAHGHDAHDHAPHDHAPHAVSKVTDAPPGANGQFTAREAHQARRLFLVLALIAVFFVAELAGAIAARSVVLQADALHLLMDVLALAMSLVAMRIAVRKPTPRFTFGMRRAEPLAAIVNALLVLGATVQIVHEAIAELDGSSAPESGIMLVVAAAALVVNGLSAWLLHGAMHHGHDHAQDHDHSHPPSSEGGPGGLGAHHGHGHTLNLRGAWLHLVGDILGSIAALVAAIVIRAGGPTAIDPIASFLVAAILVAGAYRLLRDAALVLFEAAPVHVPVGAVREVLLAYPGVVSVHDLHVWTLGGGHDAITAHVRATDLTIGHALARHLRGSFGTEYVTVQIEPSMREPSPSDPGDAAT